MLSTRSSGSSYKNRVELQNGCLSLGHASLFIPSALNGSCIISGKVNDEILCKNLDSAIDVYLSRVDKSPCAKTVIHLIKGANSDDEQKEREIVIKYLKGKAEDKKQAKLLYPDLYQKVESIWQLRQRHMVKGLPVQYVFYLRCCFNPECIHPVCRSGASVDDLWYPNGPSLDFFPSPTPDPERPFGNLNCKDCDGFCAGHYLKPDKIVNSVNIPSKAIPPSQVLAKVFKESNGFPNETVISETASDVLLKPEEVRMWFKHLEVVQNNRKEGAKKAAATRKEKKQGGRVNKTASKQPLKDTDGDELCNI